ncbi:MAG: hypothetical protein FWG14_02460 [Peptococcaceae bacterium]|nr:hypothetical protein [Peptococcaceae bacterium]
MNVMLGICVCVTVVVIIFYAAYRAWRYARMSGSGRSSVDWWGAIKQELLLMVRFVDPRRFADSQGVPGSQKSMVWLTLTVRWGVFLMIIWTVLLVIGGLAILAGVTVDAQGTLGGAVLYFLTIPAGVGGLTLTTFGVGTMILKRMYDPGLKDFAKMDDFLVLFLSFVTLVTGVLLWGGDLTFMQARNAVAQVFRFSADFQADFLLGIHLVLLNITVIYIPLSRMNSYIERAEANNLLRENSSGENLPGKKI